MALASSTSTREEEGKSIQLGNPCMGPSEPIYVPITPDLNKSFIEKLSMAVISKKEVVLLPC